MNCICGISRRVVSLHTILHFFPPHFPSCFNFEPSIWFFIVRRAYQIFFAAKLFQFIWNITCSCEYSACLPFLCANNSTSNEKKCGVWWPIQLFKWHICFLQLNMKLLQFLVQIVEIQPSLIGLTFCVYAKLITNIIKSTNKDRIHATAKLAIATAIKQ